MNTCEEYQQAIAADPSFDGGAAHLRSCASCQAFHDEMLALDARIVRALEIPVPELTLPELDDVDSSNVTPLRQRFTAPVWLAVAATVAFAAFIGVRSIDTSPADATLAEQIIAHIGHEPYSLRVTDEAVSEQRLTRVVPATVATMDHDAGLITYAQSCIINGHKVPHLVLQGRRGPVTILLMPEEPIDGAQEFSGDGVRGVLLPVGDGSIAIVGEEGESLERIEEEVRNSVKWTT